MSLEAEFEQALRGTYTAVKTLGYVATYFLQILEIIIVMGGKSTSHERRLQKILLFSVR
jgi:hypothetical protein